MFQETGKVCKSVVVQSAVVGSAVMAEKAGFIQGLEEILKEGIIVECIATDGHTGNIFTANWRAFISFRDLYTPAITK